MFRRRVRPPALQSIFTFFWPHRGWQRAGQYLWHRLQRLPGTPYSIAAGCATGSALSFTPLVGVHFFLAAALAWLIRGNVIAAMFGTVIGNPWTLPVIWLSTYEIGHLIIGRGGIEGANLNFTQMFQGLLQSMIDACWKYSVRHPHVDLCVYGLLPLDGYLPKSAQSEAFGEGQKNSV